MWHSKSDESMACMKCGALVRKRCRGAAQLSDTCPSADIAIEKRIVHPNTLVRSAYGLNEFQLVGEPKRDGSAKCTPARPVPTLDSAPEQ